MTQFKGKAIYQPSGKAAEYSQWACNFYVGCSNECTYCYLKKGIGAKILGGNKPTLKKCFTDEDNAMEIFRKELEQNLSQLQECGLFFSFTTDPLLYRTKELTMLAINECLYNDVPVKILTKKTNFIGQFSYELQCTDYDLSKIAFGFTLTGHDELEPNASSNAERIEAMKKLHDAGFKTFASIEPIIDFQSSFRMIAATHGICDLYKIGLESGKKQDKDYAVLFVANVMVRATENNSKVYFKDSILKCWGVSRESLKEYECCVASDYNLFEN